MYLLDNTSPAPKPVAAPQPHLHNKTKPTPQEWVDAYTQGLRMGKFSGRLVLTLDYVDGHLRRYRIQEPAKTIHAN